MARIKHRGRSLPAPGLLEAIPATDGKGLPSEPSPTHQHAIEAEEEHLEQEAAWGPDAACHIYAFPEDKEVLSTEQDSSSDQATAYLMPAEKGFDLQRECNLADPMMGVPEEGARRQVPQPMQAVHSIRNEARISAENLLHSTEACEGQSRPLLKQKDDPWQTYLKSPSQATLLMTMHSSSSDEGGQPLDGTTLFPHSMQAWPEGDKPTELGNKQYIAEPCPAKAVASPLFLTSQHAGAMPVGHSSAVTATTQTETQEETPDSPSLEETVGQAASAGQIRHTLRVGVVSFQFQGCNFTSSKEMAAASCWLQYSFPGVLKACSAQGSSHCLDHTYNAKNRICCSCIQCSDKCITNLLKDFFTMLGSHMAIVIHLR